MLSLAEVFVRLLAFKAVVTVEQAAYLHLDVDPKDAGVEVGSVFEGVMRAAPAVAWEDSHSERAPVSIWLRIPTRTYSCDLFPQCFISPPVFYLP